RREHKGDCPRVCRAKAKQQQNPSATRGASRSRRASQAILEADQSKCATRYAHGGHRPHSRPRHGQAGAAYSSRLDAGGRPTNTALRSIASVSPRPGPLRYSAPTSAPPAVGLAASAPSREEFRFSSPKGTPKEPITRRQPPNAIQIVALH